MCLELAGNEGRAARATTLPDGCVEMVLAGDGPALAGGAAYRGVRLRPGAGRAVLRVDLHELAGLVAPIDQVVPRGRLNGSSLAGMLTTIARTRMGETDRVAVEAARQMADGPRSVMADLSRRLSISERQLRRRFERTIGLRPSSYARIARVQRAVRLALRHGWTWTAVAYEAGFSDQAHLAREVRALTGYRPSRLIGAPDG